MGERRRRKWERERMQRRRKKKKSIEETHALRGLVEVEDGSVVVDLPSLGAQHVFILTELCFHCPGIFGLEIYCNTETQNNQGNQLALLSKAKSKAGVAQYGWHLQQGTQSALESFHRPFAKCP